MGKIHETTGTSMILGSFKGALLKKRFSFSSDWLFSFIFSAWHLKMGYPLKAGQPLETSVLAA